MDENVDLQELLDNNNLEGMRAFLEGGGDANSTVRYPMGPEDPETGDAPEEDVHLLHYVLLTDGSPEMVDLLLEHDADPTLSDVMFTPIKHAVEYNQIDYARKFLAKMGAVRAAQFINDNEEHYETPLMVAVRRENLEMVQFLLEEGGDPNVTDSQGRETSIHYAIQLIREKPDDANAKTILTKLLERGGNALDALIEAAEWNLSDVVQLLLDRGVNVNEKNDYGETALIVAAKSRSLDVMRLLLDRGADPNIKGGDDENSAILEASYYGDTPMIQLLLEKGARVDDTNDAGYTPLINLAERGNVEAVRLLLDRGADVNHQTEEPSSNTALAVASFAGHLEVVRLLLDRGANTELRTEEGWTALRQAVHNRKLDVARLLIEKGANVNAQDDLGRTPLMRAAFDNQLEIVKLLLANGADPTLRAQNGDTAADRATNPEIRELLTPKWKGLTDEDKTAMDNLLVNPAEGSFCPICLVYVKTGEDLYAEHNCKKTAGAHLHTDLRAKYSNAEGITSWCTQCGRISKMEGLDNLMFHYPLTPYQTARVPKTINYDSSMSYASLEDKCKGHGGGGIAEKVARARGRMAWSLHLQTKKLGTIGDQEAYKEIVEEAWNAPFRRQPRPAPPPAPEPELQPPPAGAASGSTGAAGGPEGGKRRRTYRKRHRTQRRR